MSQQHSMKQRAVATVRQTPYVAAAVALFIATASVVYGLTHNDWLTAVGALLLVPSIVLLYRIGSRDRSVDLTSTRRQTN